MHLQAVRYWILDIGYWKDTTSFNIGGTLLKHRWHTAALIAAEQQGPSIPGFLSVTAQCSMLTAHCLMLDAQ